MFRLCVLQNGCMLLGCYLLALRFAPRLLFCTAIADIMNSRQSRRLQACKKCWKDLQPWVPQASHPYCARNLRISSWVNSFWFCLCMVKLFLNYYLLWTITGFRQNFGNYWSLEKNASSRDRTCLRSAINLSNLGKRWRRSSLILLKAEQPNYILWSPI